MNTETSPKNDTKAPNLPDMPKEVVRAYHYHLKQLSPKEIAKLMDTTTRTVQRWKTIYNFDDMETIPDTHTETIPQKALRMSKAGLSYSQIAKKLKRCKATIYNYIRTENAKNLDNTE